MFNIDIKNNNGVYHLSLPTRFEEISKEYLIEVTKNVQVADHHTLIAVLYKEKLSNLIAAIKQSKNNTTSSVIPVFVKAGATPNTQTGILNTNDFINFTRVKDKLIISGSDISLGLHVTSELNKISISNIAALIDSDKELYRNAFKYTDTCYFIEFKIVPNNAIVGFYTEVNKEYNNPYFNAEGNAKAE